MTRITRRLLLFAGAAMTLASCKHDDEHVSGPGITRRISEFEGYACSGGTVTRYNFQNTEVFLFAPNCGVMDESFPVYDLDGNQICWVGGFAGMYECRGSNFGQEAKNPTVVFTKR